MLLVVLDLDGVVLRVDSEGMDQPDKCVRDVLEPGAAEFFRTADSRGWTTCIATNQPKIARGEMKIEYFCERMKKLRSLCTVGHIEVCPHDDDDDCACRKPLAGMLLNAMERFGVSANETVFIGDRVTDLSAAKAVPVRFIRYRSSSVHDERFRSHAFQGATVSSFPELIEQLECFLAMRNRRF